MQSNQDTIAGAYLDEATHQLEKAVMVIGHCLDQLDNGQLSWRPHPAMNSIGNLIRHLCGNVQQWIIAGVGGEGDVRDRPREFAEQGPFDRQELIEQLSDLRQRAASVLQGVTAEQLLQARKIQGFETTGLAAIFDSVAHFKGHTQEIVSLTRAQLGDAYEFQWEPTTPEEGAAEA
jgi:hypothetical protein